MDRTEIIAAAQAMANNGDGLMRVFCDNMADLKAKAPDRYERMMSAMEQEDLRDASELHAYICD